MSADQHIRCSTCDYTRNLVVNLVCEQCQRPLFKVRWPWFILLIASLFATGMLIGDFGDTLLASVILLLLFAVYISLLFRVMTSKRNLALLLLLLTAPIALLELKGRSYSWMPNEHQASIAILSLISIMALYVAYRYYLEWHQTCVLNDVGLVRGLPVVAFSLYLATFIVGYANLQLAFLKPEISSLLAHQFHFRTMLLVLLLIHTLSVAYINTTKRSIRRPDPLFTNTTANIKLWNPDPSNNYLLNSALLTARAFINALLTFYRHAIELFKAGSNSTKIALHYLARLLITYTLEVLSQLLEFMKLFFETMYRFFRRHLLPLALCYGISLAVIRITEILSLYVNSKPASFYGAIGFIILILLGIIIFVWTLTDYKLSSVLASVTVSNIWLSFTLFISSLIASWGLWLAAQFYLESPYGKLGKFTASSSLLLFLALIIVFLVRLRSANRSA